MLIIAGAKKGTSFLVSFLSGHQPDNCWVPGWLQSFCAFLLWSLSSFLLGSISTRMASFNDESQRPGRIDFLFYDSSYKSKKKLYHPQWPVNIYLSAFGSESVKCSIPCLKSNLFPCSFHLCFPLISKVWLSWDLLQRSPAEISRQNVLKSFPNLPNQTQLTQAV